MTFRVTFSFAAQGSKVLQIFCFCFSGTKGFSFSINILFVYGLFCRWTYSPFYESRWTLLKTENNFKVIEISSLKMLIHLQLAAVLDSFSSAVVLWRFSFNESRKDSNSLERERRFVYIALASCKTSGTSVFHRPQGSTILRTISRALIGPVQGTPNMYTGIWNRLLMKYSCHASTKDFIVI